MAGLYPTLEDMKFDHLAKAQDRAIVASQEAQQGAQQASAPPPYPIHPDGPAAPTAPAPTGTLSRFYPSLHEYMGLELTPELIAAQMPEYAVPPQNTVATKQTSILTAPLSGSSVGLMRAQVSHGIREVVLCKDGQGKVGLRCQAINKGVFVILVAKGSPASIAGLRFGDQILQINNETVAGYSMDKVHEMFKKSGNNNIYLAVRDRPFERTVTMHKDSTNHIGFQFRSGKITAIVKDSSAARNGLLTEHQLLEINGQNVVGVKDKDITSIIDNGGDIITVTIMPSFIYDHMIKSTAGSIIQKMMDHSLPEL